MFTAKCRLYNKSGNSKPKRKQDIAPRNDERKRKLPNGNPTETSKIALSTSTSKTEDVVCTEHEIHVDLFRNVIYSLFDRYGVLMKNTF